MELFKPIHWIHWNWIYWFGFKVLRRAQNRNSSSMISGCSALLNRLRNWLNRISSKLEAPTTGPIRLAEKYPKTRIQIEFNEFLHEPHMNGIYADHYADHYAIRTIEFLDFESDSGSFLQTVLSLNRAAIFRCSLIRSWPPTELLALNLIYKLCLRTFFNELRLH